MSAVFVKAVRWAGFPCVALSLAFAGFCDEEKRPVVVIAHRYDATELMADVLNPCDIVNRRDSWMSPLKYEKFSAVYLGGTVKGVPPQDGFSDVADFAAVKKFVKDGGTLILGKLAPLFLLKGQPAAGELFGFKGMVRYTDVDGVRVKRDGKKHDWCTEADVLVPERLAPETEVLASFVSAKSAITAPAAVRHPYGRGQVYWVQMPYVSLKARFEKKNVPLTVDGANGEHILTVEGQLVDSLAKFYQGIFKSARNVQYEHKEAGWGLQPLGEPGTLQVDDTFRNNPVFLPRKTHKDAFVLVGRGVKAVVVAPTDDKVLAPLADEIAWHLSQMSGETVQVVGEIPEKGPAVVLGGAETAIGFGVDFAKFRHEESVVRIRGERVYVGGEGFAGASHAVTYFLESLGCRYLWPGKTGKVIPKRNPLLMPAIDADFVPTMYARGVRGGGLAEGKGEGWERAKAALVHFGVDPELWRAGRNAAYIDRAGNRDFHRWHGICDNVESKLAVTDSKCPWKIGHYFGDFWTKYGKSHPEWFALQMSGTRYQNLGRRQNRPTLCLSNEDLAKETAHRLAAMFDAYPWKEAWTVGLPDGGPTQECMCPKCRALDPVNAPKDEWTFYNPVTAQREKYEYVPITDRYVVFMNRVMAELRKLKPGKCLTFYAYNNYTTPPVAVRPDPDLICLSTSGNYTNFDGLQGARRNIAKWQRLCTRTLWRPNALWAFCQSAVPQNFAKSIGGDIEAMKANGLLGTDFDCMGDEWAVKGLTYYVVMRALLNPDRLSPEDTIADYCASGFGKAASEMRRYFDGLEETFIAASKVVSSGKDKIGTDDQDKRIFYARAIIDAFDAERLGAILDRAETLVADDAESLERVRFVRIGWTFGRYEKLLAAAYEKGGAEYDRLRGEYRANFAREALDHPFACPPYNIAKRNPFMNNYNPAKERQ